MQLQPRRQPGRASKASLRQAVAFLYQLLCARVNVRSAFAGVWTDNRSASRSTWFAFLARTVGQQANRSIGRAQVFSGLGRTWAEHVNGQHNQAPSLCIAKDVSHFCIFLCHDERGRLLGNCYAWKCASKHVVLSWRHDTHDARRRRLVFWWWWVVHLSRR